MLRGMCTTVSTIDWLNTVYACRFHCKFTEHKTLILKKKQWPKETMMDSYQNSNRENLFRLTFHKI